MNLKTKISLAGFYRLQVHSQAGELKHDTGWFPNLITNQGLDWFGAGAPNYATPYHEIIFNTHCGVGLGTTPPAYTDTQLTTPLAMQPDATSYIAYSGASYVAGPPAYWSLVWTYSFATGAVVGNVAEVGTGGTSASTDTTPYLFSHALILDGSGNPTTLPVTATDALTVTYELRHYLDLTDNTYSVNLNGVTYSGTYRRARVTTVPSFAQQCDYNANGINFAVNCNVYNGTIQSVTSYPTGASGGGGNQFSTSASTYTNGTYYKNFVITAPSGYGNLAGGITAIEFYSNLGNWQFSVSPAIPKDSTKTMTLNWDVSWSRYP